MNYYEDEIEVEEENLEDEIEVEEENVIVNTGGTTDHSKLKHLDYENSGHTGFASSDDLQTETTSRQTADTNLQEQIDAITVSSDVVDIVGTYQDLQNYDTTKLTDDDIIKVMQDSTHSNAMSYYRWSSNAWVYVGSEGPFYTKSESDNKYQEKLISGENVKTINNVPILGSGNLVIKGGYPEVPEKLYEHSNLLELLNDEIDIPDGIYTVSQEWYCDIPKADEEMASDNINPHSILYIDRNYGVISWTGTTASIYWSNNDGAFFGGYLTNSEDVEALIDDKLGTNIVKTDTDQDITGIKTIRATDGLKFRYGSEATRTIIKPISGGMAVAYTNAQGVTDNNFEFSQGYNTSNKTLIPKDTVAQDLGKSDRLWNTLYALALHNGTTRIAISDIAEKSYVDNAVSGKQDKLTAGTGIAITNNVISSTLEGIDYEVDQELPQTGEKGIIYLIPNGSSETENIYDEYIWIPPLQEGESGRFEFIGTTQTDLTNYVDLTSAQTISGNKTFDYGSKLKFNTSGGTNAYNVYVDTYGNLEFDYNNTKAMYVNSSSVLPGRNANVDLGSSGLKWQNLYLAYNLMDGTNVTSVASINNNMASKYDATATYAVGDRCIYNGRLYKCNTAITTAEAWNSSHWTATSVDDLIGNIDTALQNLVSGNGVV